MPLAHCASIARLVNGQEKPLGHTVQVGWPITLKVPGLQGCGARFGVRQENPGGHCPQLSVWLGSVRFVPAGHGTGGVDGVTHVKPARQRVQGCSTGGAPGSGNVGWRAGSVLLYGRPKVRVTLMMKRLKVPCGQALGELVPEVVHSVPAGQSVQLPEADPELKVPGGQAVQAGAPAPLKEPGKHALGAPAGAIAQVAVGPMVQTGAARLGQVDPSQYGPGQKYPCGQTLQLPACAPL